ncbi:uncharacterized protein LOC113873595 [Abrus precatorius]|uniref:Uncharacterized protein LOC113873595 n=1 Tax=Abrus precatorius TaxID=3816 RepID=A0A8B8MG87_ABRPR|nr:uncharacterized protein LOC113873595 [Abrus precatorius]
MAYQNYNEKYYRWRYPYDEYEAARPRQHKGHVTHRTTNHEAKVEGNVESSEESTRFGNHSAFKSVDQEAEAFIQYEHRRMELARLASIRPE